MIGLAFMSLSYSQSYKGLKPKQQNRDKQPWFFREFGLLTLKWNKPQERTAMILRKSVPGPPMGIFDGHIVRFSGGFCQTSLALRTTVFNRKFGP